MREGVQTAPELVVMAGTERVRVTGRAALIIAEIVRRAERINQIPVGRMAVDFAHGKTKFEVAECSPALRLDLGGSHTTQVR